MSLAGQNHASMSLQRVDVAFVDQAHDGRANKIAQSSNATICASKPSSPQPWAHDLQQRKCRAAGTIARRDWQSSVNLMYGMYKIRRADMISTQPPRCRSGSIRPRSGYMRRPSEAKKLCGRAYLALEHMQLFFGCVGKRPNADNHHRCSTLGARCSNVLPADISHAGIMKLACRGVE